MLLRIEDIDQTRCREEYVTAILEDTAWLGVTWDGDVRIQSEHWDDYRAALARLSALGVVYPCFCTRRDIQEAAGAPQGGRAPIYPGTCKRLDVVDRELRIGSGAPYALRLDAERALGLTGPLTFLDEQSGRTPVKLTHVGDFVVARKETPTSYHLSVVVDDALQGVTLVTRGVDLLDACHPQRLLQALLELPELPYAHHALVKDDEGKRMAKRDASTTIRSLREAGWRPQDVLGEAERRARLSGL